MFRWPYIPSLVLNHTTENAPAGDRKREHFCAGGVSNTIRLRVMTIVEKAEKLRQLDYNVRDQVGIRSKTGENVLYINGDHNDFDERFVDQLIAGDTFEEVSYRRNAYLKSLP